MLRSKMKLTGRLSIHMNGELVQETTNLVTTVGVDYVASRMKDTAETAMSHMAIGTGTTAAAVGDTTLQTEGGRVALASTTVTNEEVVYIATFPAGTGTGAVTEAGILNAASGGTLLTHTIFTAVNKTAVDAMTITWTVTVS